MAESVAANDQKFEAAMVGQIKRNVESVKVLIDQYNAEYDLLKEVITKSLAVKIDEVREDERKKAEEALKKQALENQRKEEEALKRQALEHQRKEEEALKS